MYFLFSLTISLFDLITKQDILKVLFRSIIVSTIQVIEIANKFVIVTRVEII